MNQITETQNSTRMPVLKLGFNSTEMYVIGWMLHPHLWVKQHQCFHSFRHVIGSWDNPIGAATGYGLDDLQVSCPEG
jgi:hypothetical protein